MRFGLSLVLVLTVSSSALGTTIAVPNFSFESPPVVRDEQNPFGALPFLDDWDETAVGLADENDQDTGVFLNTDVGEPDHIVNAEADRLAFINSVIGNAVRQELPDTFTLNTTYVLRVAVGTSSFFSVGATEKLQVSLFYFNGLTEQIVASAFILGSQVNANSLVDVTLNMPPVESGDPWLGEQIGVLIRPAIDDPDDGAGEGFWNLDNVRLQSTSIPAVSTWGLVSLAIAVAIGGTLALSRRNTFATG